MKVTSPLLPPLDAVKRNLDRIWDSEHVTNFGSVHVDLETKISQYLNAPHTSLIANGTLALMGALTAAGVRAGDGGEIITTAYSYAATAQVILQMGLTPVFTDVDAGTANLSPREVYKAITPRTRAILPVHCYGAACDVEGFEALRRETKLPLVYDASHCFGALHQGRSLAAFGDAASLSFHATKVFNTIEGGAIVCSTPKIHERAKRWRNFGYAGETNIDDVGINAKMSELHAAVGLANLDIIDAALDHRHALMKRYQEALGDVSGLSFLPVGQNAPYCPLMVGDAFPLSRDETYDRLRDAGITVRRYFYPLITDFAAFKAFAPDPETLPEATRLAAQVISLPLHHDLTLDDVAFVADALTSWAAPKYHHLK